ncbi:MAG: CHAT domain-containing protein [Thermoanaerobaculia bacterium]
MSNNSQNIQISGSSGVSLGDIQQNVGAPELLAETAESPQRVRVLFLAACPSGAPPLRLDQEMKAIQEALRMSKNGDRFEVEQIWAAGDRELQDGLLRYSPDLVHLSAHGSRTGQILLEPGSPVRDLGGRPAHAAQPEALWLQGLVGVFAAARGRVRCVVLNACHSEPVAQALAQVVGCVVGMSEAIEDAAAIRFSWSFYNALGYGMSIKAAFDLAMGQIAMAGLRTSEVPRLITAGVSPEDLTFG